MTFQFVKNKLKNFVKNNKIKKEISRYYTIGQNSVLYNSGQITVIDNNRQSIDIGNYCHIRGRLHTFLKGNISMGDYCYVGENSNIWSASKILIGNRVLIAHNVNIHDNISHPLDPDLRHEDFKKIIGLNPNFDISHIDLRAKNIIINDDAWIGFNSTIYKGITIGKSAIVGSNSLVLEDVPDYAIVVGNPAKVIKYVNNE